ncbi:MAG: putative toxin-antitoxin system toxin component, PIN family [Nanoarchaeota archaeon]
MKVVLDTNIFISGIFWKGNPNKIINLWKEDSLILFTSKEIIDEFIEVMEDFKIKMPPSIINEWVDLIIKKSILVQPKEKFNLIKDDPSDNKFLECAYKGKVNYIISKDKHLLKLKQFKNIKIVTPEEFLKNE